MKRFISFILLAIMFITSCEISQSAEENDDKKAVIAAFEDYINAAKNEDTKKVSEYHLMWFNIWRTSQESYKYLTYKINDVKIINENYKFLKRNLRRKFFFLKNLKSITNLEDSDEIKN